MSYRYIGNKTRLVPSIMEIVGGQLRAGAVVADLMCGTGSVSLAMRRAGFRVVAADIMTFAYLHARVRLTLNCEPPFRGLGMAYRQVLASLNRLSPTHGYFYREHSPAGSPEAGVPPRAYFTPENAGRLDAIVRTLCSWKGEKKLSGAEFALLRHDLVLAGNRVANIAGTYGHFRSTWSASSLARLALVPTEFETRGTTRHVVKQGPAERIAKGLRADLCYLDPPYTKRQYAANYHIPETLARCDEPPAIGMSGLRPWRDQYSDFCSKRRVRDSFRSIITQMDCPRFLVSYSEDGLLRREQLEELLAEFGRTEIIEIPARRFRSNQSCLPREITEYVFALHRS
ncbi:MAG: DNA adenine methylase [Gaiellaceae bacterium]